MTQYEYVFVNNNGFEKVLKFELDGMPYLAELKACRLLELCIIRGDIPLEEWSVKEVKVNEI